jgi:hypothetical protein
MLLCRDHHLVIDRLVRQHGVEGLRRMKREHEDRIYLLTGLREDASTVVIRMIGTIRDAPVEVPPEAILPTVIAEGRFPRFPLAMAGEDIEIDLRLLPNESHSDYWNAGEKIIATQVARVRDAQQAVQHLSVFALARIPLLVALGYYLDDKIPTTIYGRRRDGTGDGAWGFDPNAQPASFEVTQRSGPIGVPKVALGVSVTAPIGEDVIESLGNDTAVYELAPEGVPYGRDLLSGRTSLDHFADAYHEFLGRVEADHRDCAVIDIYAAVPAAGAVQLGRGLMRDAQPLLRIHDRGPDGQFSEALTLRR